MEEVIADVAKTARELEVEPKVTELLQSHDRIFNEWGVASHGWAKKVVSWDNISSSEDAVNIVEMETRLKTLKYYMNLVDKAAAGFGRTDSNLFFFIPIFKEVQL